MSKRACDGCRRRKVKCDAKSPTCSNCSMSELTCEYTVPAKKRGPPFKIDKLNDRSRDKSSKDKRVTRATVARQGAIERPLIEVAVDNGPAPVSEAENHVNHPVEQLCTHTSSPFSEARDELLSAIGRFLPSTPLDEVLSHCIDLYMQWDFPLGPVVCEPMLRRTVPLVVTILKGESEITGVSGPNHPAPDLQPMRAFALVTAACAFVSSGLPANMFPAGNELAWPFLRASRETLRLYQDRDVEHPDSSSVIVRYFHSNALHALGKTRVSWHVMGEALRLVQEMRLYDEGSFAGLDWPEAHLRRNAFWHLYIGDKSASILNGVPISLHQICLDGPITTTFDADLACDLMDPSRDAALEDRLRVGFHLCFRLWYAASEMLVDLNVLSRLQQRRYGPDAALHPPGVDDSDLRNCVVQSYFDFMSILHECPDWIRDPPSAAVEAPDDAAARFRSSCFYNQKANLFVTFHALRLVLVSRFAGQGLPDFLGLTSDPAMLALRKVEIASDLVGVVTGLPFEALQANGEPCVEKLRQVGVALLEIMHSVRNEAIAARARTLFGTLLDILARLNSRWTSTILRGDPPHDPRLHHHPICTSSDTAGLIQIARIHINTTFPSAVDNAKMAETRTFSNPIVPGFAPDPSVVFVDGVFYLATSSFHVFPGIPIYASTDLQEWKHIGNAINRREQLSLTRASTAVMPLDTGNVMVASAGLFAPTIRYHEGTFYIVCTNAIRGDGGRLSLNNFYVSTDDIWS
ncbi:hypothetical protein CMUS01_14399, partial [Colletotrichum musicola]